MSSELIFSSIGTLSLTREELDILQSLLDGGDRGAFHYVYATMSDVQDALVTSKISTFSGLVGGSAFAANVYGQTLYSLEDADRDGVPDGSEFK